MSTKEGEIIKKNKKSRNNQSISNTNLKEIRDYENKICLTSSIHQKWHGNWIGGVASTI